MHRSALSAVTCLLHALSAVAAPVAHSSSAAAPASEFTWDEGATPDFLIHESCNVTESSQLQGALDEAVTLASHAADHILRYGNASEHYRRYFGDAPSGLVLGWYDLVARGDRAHSLFRCDNIDGNCDQEGWGGHWRGANATGETVICPLSYETRKPLAQMCALGYTVAGSKTNFYFASDLLHRLWHMPAFSQGVIDHFAEDYAGVLALATTEPEKSTMDTDALQYFALDVYAYDVAVPGQGCTGEVEVETNVATPPATSTVAATQAPTSTEIAKSCHTHSDGTEHCV